MSNLNIIKAAVVVGEAEPSETRFFGKNLVSREGHTVSLAGGVPTALDGVAPVIVVRVVDPERDTARLLRAAEELLPVYRQAPGVVILDGEDMVQGVAPRTDLERAVLQMRRRDYVALAKGLGLRADYRPPAGNMARPFVYWACPQCQHVRVPQEGHEDDPPPQCRLHDPPALVLGNVAVELQERGGQLAVRLLADQTRTVREFACVDHAEQESRQVLARAVEPSRR